MAALLGHEATVIARTDELARQRGESLAKVRARLAAQKDAARAALEAERQAAEAEYAGAALGAEAGAAALGVRRAWAEENTVRETALGGGAVAAADRLNERRIGIRRKVRQSTLDAEAAAVEAAAVEVAAALMSAAVASTQWFRVDDDPAGALCLRDPSRRAASTRMVRFGQRYTSPRSEVFATALLRLGVAYRRTPRLDDRSGVGAAPGQLLVASRETEGWVEVQGAGLWLPRKYLRPIRSAAAQKRADAKRQALGQKHAAAR